MKVAVISASLGGIDDAKHHTEQTVPYDYFLFTDQNFPPRFNSMTPRLQAKIPKFFGWQLKPGYDYYVWIDGAITMSHPDTLKWLVENCDGVDLATFKHDKRTRIEDEARRIRKSLEQGSRYMSSRYTNEWLDEQMAEIHADKDYVDDTLAAAGVFIYKNTSKAHDVLKEWWYHVSRYLIQDQLAFPYVLKTSGIKFKMIPEIYWDCK